MGGTVLTKAELLKRIEELEKKVAERPYHYHYHYHQPEYWRFPYNSYITNTTDLWNVIGSQSDS